MAVNSYRGNGGGGHLIEGAGISQSELDSRIISSTDKGLRYYMMRWIEKQNEVELKATENWKVIPYDWWRNGKQKDSLQLYGTD